MPSNPSLARSSASTNASTARTGLLSLIQSSRHSGNKVDCPRSAPTRKRFIRSSRKSRENLIRESNLATRFYAARVIRDHVGLTGTKYGCGAGLCGACTVHVNGKALRSCQTAVSEVADKTVVTIEGLSPNSSHPLQKAWVALEVPQCGYCQSGQIMKAAELLASNPKPSREQIVEHMDGNICRCGTYHRIIAAVETASREG